MGLCHTCRRAGQWHCQHVNEYGNWTEESPIMTQRDELREKVREALLDHSCDVAGLPRWEVDGVLDENTDALVALIAEREEQVRADERERCATLIEDADPALAEFIRSQGDKP